MKKEELYRSIGNLDERLIDDSEIIVKSNHWGRWGCLAACAAIAVLIAAAGAGYWSGARGKNGAQLAGNDGDGRSMIGAGTEMERTQATESQPDDSQEPAPAVERGPIRYSELQLAENPLDPEVAAQFEGSGAAACIAEFEESMLKHCAGIVEGVVTDIYVKTYTYQLAFDKFGEQGIINQNTRSVVYEIAVDKTWYGQERTGQKILIEDSMFFADEMFAVKEGHRYVIPFEEAGDSIYVLPDYVGGDCARDSIYSTLYEFHPQIEVTLDGNYVVSKDWGTLYAGDVREIVMDHGELDDSSLAYFYRDRMGLMSAGAFAERMEVLLAKIFS